jgi:hypothetical protein
MRNTLRPPRWTSSPAASESDEEVDGDFFSLALAARSSYAKRKGDLMPPFRTPNGS